MMAAKLRVPAVAAFCALLFSACSGGTEAIEPSDEGQGNVSQDNGKTIEIAENSAANVEDIRVRVYNFREDSISIGAEQTDPEDPTQIVTDTATIATHETAELFDVKLTLVEVRSAKGEEVPGGRGSVAVLEIED